MNRGAGRVACLLLLAALMKPGAGLAAAPVLSWSRTVNGSADGTDQANGVTFGPSSAVFVAGFQTVTGEGQNWIVRAYDSAGNVQWTRTWDGPNSTDDGANAVAVDGTGAVVVAGFEWFNAGDDRWLVQKYSAAGGDVMSFNFNGLVGAANHATGVGIGPSDQITITGWDQYAGPSTGWMVRTYDSAGGILWSRTYRDPWGDTDRSYAVAVNAKSGVVVVAGDEERNDLGETYNFTVRSYDSAGNDNWSDMYDGGSGQGDGARAIALDSSANVIVVGATVLPAGDEDWLIRKYNSAGSLLWSKGYGGSAAGDDGANAVAVDSSDNIIVAGTETTSNGDTDWLVRAYSPAGALLWSLTYGGASGEDDSPRAVAAGAPGDIVVAGYETRSDLGEAENLVVRKYIFPTSGGCGPLAWTTMTSMPTARDGAGGTSDGITFYVVGGSNGSNLTKL